MIFTFLKNYLQSTTARLDEWRVRRRDTEEWMRHRQLPQELQERVRRFVQYKWLTTRGVDEEAILRALPLDLPLSTRTVRTLSEVEAFALRAEDFKFVANQFRRLHSKKLQHASGNSKIQLKFLASHARFY